MDRDETQTSGLLAIVVAVGAAAVAAIALRGRGTGRAVVADAPALAESAAEASERVYQEFQASAAITTWPRWTRPSPKP